MKTLYSNKKTKGIISIIIVISICISSFVSVGANDNSDADSIPWLKTEAEAIEFVADIYRERKDSVTFKYSTPELLEAAQNKDKKTVRKLLKRIFDEAKSEEYAKGSYEGDYYKYASIGTSYGTGYVYDDSRSKVLAVKIETMGCSGAFTNEQQKEIETFVHNACNELGLYDNEKTALQKVKIIHDYICRINTYDYEAFHYFETVENVEDEKYMHAGDIYGVIHDGKSVCAGYAHTMYVFCKEAGVPVRIIDNNDHAWNLVSIDGGKTFYNIDVTWDDQETIKDFHDRFLKSDADIQSDNSVHYRTEEFMTKEFLEKYPVPTQSYVEYKKIGNETVAFCPYCNQRLYGSKNEHVNDYNASRNTGNNIEDYEVKLGRVVIKKVKRKRIRVKKKKRKKKKWKNTNKIYLSFTGVANATEYEISVYWKKKDLKRNIVCFDKSIKSNKTKVTLKSSYFKKKKKMYIRVRAVHFSDYIISEGKWSKAKRF